MNKVYRLVGDIPSKKNSRINTRSGRSFPSKKFSDWQDYAMQEILLQGKVMFEKPVRIRICILFKNKRRQDLDNRLSSILDMLVKIGVLKDDSWSCVPQIEVYAGLNDRKQTDTKIEIEEML